MRVGGEIHSVCVCMDRGVGLATFLTCGEVGWLVSWPESFFGGVVKTVWSMLKRQRLANDSFIVT